MKKLEYLLFFLLSGCISSAQEIGIEKKINLKSDDDFFSIQKNAYQHQVKLSYSIGDATVTGMAVPVSTSTLITAAHVVINLEINGHVNVIYKEALFSKERNFKGIVKNINIQNDSATLELVDGELPVSSIPKFCTYRAGNLMAGGKLSGMDGDLTQLTVFDGVLSYIDEMPIVSDHYNLFAKDGGYPPLKMVGQNKIVGILRSEATSGNSGGAIFDMERDACVIGVVSLIVPLQELKQPSKMAKRLGISKNDPFAKDRKLIIGVPINDYNK